MKNFNTYIELTEHINEINTHKIAEEVLDKLHKLNEKGQEDLNDFLFEYARGDIKNEYLKYTFETHLITCDHCIDTTERFKLMFNIIDKYGPEVVATVKVREIIQNAEEKIKQCQYDEAISKYKEAILINSGSSDIFQSIGEAYLKKGDHIEALNSFKNALSLNADNLEAHERLQRFNNDITKKIEDKIEKLDKEIAVDVENFEIRLILARAYFYLGSIKSNEILVKSAIEEGKKVIQIESNYVDAYLNLALFYDHLGLIDNGLEMLLRAKNIAPDDSRIYIGLACSYLNKGHHDKALSECENAIKLTPSCIGALKISALATLLQGRFDETTKYCNDTLEMEPFDIHARYYLARTYYEKELYDKVISECNDVIKLQPIHIPSYNLIASVYFKRKNYKSLIDVTKRALNISPTDQQPNFYLGAAYLMTDKLDLAIERFEKVPAGIPEYYWSNLFVGLEYIKRKEYSRGNKFIDKILSGYPNDPTANMASGQCHEASGDYAEAVKRYKNARMLFLKENNADEHIKDMIDALEVGIDRLKIYEVNKEESLPNDQIGSDIVALIETVSTRSQLYNPSKVDILPMREVVSYN